MATHPPRRLLAPLWTAAAAALALAACSEDKKPVAPETPSPCTGNVTVSVSAGTTPTFTWSPACGVVALLVESDASDVWLIESTGAAGIAPGVRYGTVPSGAAREAPAEPLVAGQAYDVIVFRGSATNPALAGLKEFTP